ncbi:MAG: hypothetical protein ACD_17C00425G0003 [uncultured bacterium]|nr:MAG: hypothetical protein ACD_17C00425G0003 [uncultured bacterium]OGN56662.1 MAG: hypothetical protein A2796_03785 [Chlamydiae bacterium RIFCSPHIGHO2_01_FULL_44_39]OGN57194.1 MAG: hypothetical protein A3C42_02110 [Chlamydiae bacterium RIFCSPHIGHO2_02_FULL_45_9]OGN61170.1 MAG: hypothetical protein A3D96_05960 [Chlamydiae bacterium RIFCSPHIGHO2_12_FULL_44_59]OGN65640.1 MAG: hypothetical protein A2978_06765 [Chlamydiae bacterium RIFCSPLOWO2_01_FULL_44_52]OGN68117.1 MAG: hypothetical protein A3
MTPVFNRNYEGSPQYVKLIGSEPLPDHYPLESGSNRQYVYLSLRKEEGITRLSIEVFNGTVCGFAVSNDVAQGLENIYAESQRRQGVVDQRFIEIFRKMSLGYQAREDFFGPERTSLREYLQRKELVEDSVSITIFDTEPS